MTHLVNHNVKDRSRLIPSLSEQLEICEEEANVFIYTFMSTYPGVKRFIESILVDCKKNGYVKTIGGRRRYLPNIQSKNTELLG